MQSLGFSKKGKSIDFSKRTTKEKPVESLQDRITRTIEANFGNDYSIPLYQPGTPEAEITSFLNKLAMSEGSNNPQAEIQTQNGRRFEGLYQFRAARFVDFKRTNGESFTIKEFKADADLQDRVALWHHSCDWSWANSYDRNGLRAVPHLGVKSDIQKYVKSKGMYSLSDQLRNSLRDYYDIFSSVDKKFMLLALQGHYERS